jgi:type 1 fimbria pilin
MQIVTDGGCCKKRPQSLPADRSYWHKGTARAVGTVKAGPRLSGGFELRNSIMSKIITLIFLFLASCIPATGWAACTGTAVDVIATSTGDNPPIINPNAANGTVYWTSPIMLANLPDTVKCSPSIGTVTVAAVGVYNATYQTYSTNIPGVGLRFTIYVPVTGTLPMNSVNTWSSLQSLAGTTPVTFVFSIVKTGPITQGGSVSGRILSLWATQPPPSNSGAYLGYIDFPGAVVINPGIPTCAVTTPSIVVPMGSYLAQKTFTGVGTVSPAQPFNIGLNCAGGTTGISATVYTTLTDQTNPGNVSSTLSLSSNSTAKGVGIQILNGTTPVSFGPDSSVVGNTNQWQAGVTGNTSFTIPLAARYVQTASTVSAGTANGMATFTMSYQ